MSSVSIIIATYQREKVLQETLKSLLSLAGSFEIIVVEQTPKKYRLESILHPLIKYVEVVYPHIASAYNLGVKEATGDIILFLDDDVIPYDSYLVMKHLQNYSDPLIGGVGGRIITEGHPLRTTPDPRIFHPITGFLYLGNYNLLWKGEIPSPQGCNMSFRKELLLKTGGFDNRFLTNCHRVETELAFRMRKLGYKIVYEPEACVYHLFFPQGGSRAFEKEISSSESYFYNNFLFIRKYFIGITRIYAILALLRREIFSAILSRTLKKLTKLSLAYRGYKLAKRMI